MSNLMSIILQSSGDYAAFYGFMGATSALVFACLGAAYGTAKSGVGVCAMGVMRPELVMRNIIPVVMAGVIGIYGLIIAVIISTGISGSTSIYTGLANLGGGLSVGLSGLAAGMAIGIVGDAGVRATAQQPILGLAVAQTNDIWKSCGTSADHVKNLKITISPDPPVKGKDVTINASGDLDETVSSGDVHLTLSYIGIPIIDSHYDLCELIAKVNGTCPIKGQLKMGMTENIPSWVPSGEYKAHVTATEQNKQEMLCVDVDLKL
jgi:V-type H+-transporting ATPase proteolipid subunit